MGRSYAVVALAPVSVALIRFGATPERTTQEAPAELASPHVPIATDTELVRSTSPGAGAIDDSGGEQSSATEPELPASWRTHLFSVSGTAFSNDGPKAGLSVELFVKDEVERATTTGEDGTFAIQDLTFQGGELLWIDRHGIFATPVEVNTSVDHAAVNLEVIALPLEVDESSSVPDDLWEQSTALGFASEARGLLADSRGTLEYRGITDQDGALMVRGLQPGKLHCVAASSRLPQRYLPTTLALLTSGWVRRTPELPLRQREPDRNSKR